jgi:hypothetical protein
VQWQQLLRQYCITFSLNKLLQAEDAKHVHILYVSEPTAGTALTKRCEIKTCILELIFLLAIIFSENFTDIQYYVQIPGVSIIPKEKKTSFRVEQTNSNIRIYTVIRSGKANLNARTRNVMRLLIFSMSMLDIMLEIANYSMIHLTNFKTFSYLISHKIQKQTF